MTVISTRYDLTFSEELTDPKEFLYSMTTTTMCSDVSIAQLACMSVYFHYLSQCHNLQVSHMFKKNVITLRITFV